MLLNFFNVFGVGGGGGEKKLLKRVAEVSKINGHCY